MSVKFARAVWRWANTAARAMPVQRAGGPELWPMRKKTFIITSPFRYVVLLFRTSMLLSCISQSECLSIARSKLLAVDYAVRVTISASNQVTVTLPIRIINMISVDPPPQFCAIGADNPIVNQYRYESDAPGLSRKQRDVDDNDTSTGAGTLPSYRTKAPSQFTYKVRNFFMLTRSCGVHSY